MSSNMGSALYICLSEKWASVERSVLRDASIAREHGFTPIIYNLQDSFLDLKARKLGFKTFHHVGKTHTNVVSWHKLRNLPKILKHENVKLVHCYNLNFLWPMSFFLRGMPKVPLFLTQSKEIRKNYNSFIYTLLSSRVDQVFIPISALEKNIWGQLGIPSRKVVSMGFGIVNEDLYDPNLSGRLRSMWKTEETDFNVGICIPMHLKTINSLKPAIYGAMGLNQKLNFQNQVKLILFSEKNWNESLIYPELTHFIKDLGIEENVLFYSGSDVLTFQKAVDLWIGSLSEDEFEDYSMIAVSQGLPIVIPRSTSSMEILRIFGPIGETFKRDDSRDLRDQCSKVLKDRTHYSRLIEKVSPKLLDSFGIESYREVLIKSYLKSREIRRRYFGRRASDVVKP